MARRQDGRITAVVFSYNEAELLAACLERLQEFDELLVCDMQSSDGTQSVAREHTAAVLEVPFAPIAETVRQRAIDAVTTEWLLFVDADEHLPEGFLKALQLPEFPDDVAGVRLLYDNVAFGTQLRYTLQGSAKYSLLRSDLAHYPEDERPHQLPVFSGRALDAPDSVPPILHLNFRSADQTLEKVLRYARTDPKEGDLLGDPLKSAKELVWALGSGSYRDGRAGLVVVSLHVFGRFYGRVLDWEQQGRPEPPLSPRNRAVMRALSFVLAVLSRSARWRRAAR